MAWQPGDDPTTHPLWADQVELELEMVRAGSDAYRKRIAKANGTKKDGTQGPAQMTMLPPYRHMMETLATDMALGLKAWLNNTAKARRKKGTQAEVAYYRLKDFDPHLAAYITVRTVLNALQTRPGGRFQSALATGQSIGLQLEYEGRMEAWFALEPKLFEGQKDRDRMGNRKVFLSLQRKLKDQKATDHHKERVNINRFNTLMRERVQWQDWSSHERKYVGLKLLDILCQTTGQFEIVEDPEHKRTSLKQGRYVVAPSEDLTTHLVEAVEFDETRHPAYMPTLIPPKRWDGMRGGGYYTPIVRPPKLIRFKADNEEVQGAAMEEYDALDMPKVMSALNKVQEVPWRINEKVLSVALEIWERDLGIAGFIPREKEELPPRPAGMDRVDLKGDPNRRMIERAWMEAHPEETRAWKKAAAEVYGNNSRRLSNAQAVTTTMALAERLRGKEFYFPHMLDFRGRMYPIPAYLQPQGQDLARGLLTFAHGRPVTPENGGEGWLAVHLANVWGNDKISFMDRVEWVYANEDLWVRIYEDPLGNLEWTHQTDDCWQALAAIFEWIRYRQVGAGMSSSLPVRVDGTCNGIQHLSAMMRDETGGASVNLYPSDAPRDIYKEVADALMAKLEGIEAEGGQQGQLANLWLEGTKRNIPRDLTKNPVMVLPYGGTKESYYGSIHKWLGKQRKKGVTVIPDQEIREAVPFLVGHLWDSVSDVVVAGRVCMEWLKECAKIVSDIEQPIFWTTKTGFHVRHFYGKMEAKVVETKINGKRMQFLSMERSKRLSRKDQLQGISPNFVHSQDAAVNMETIRSFMNGANGDPPPFTTIHDAFGTIAACMNTLHDRIREAFIEIHSEDVLDGFRQRCVLMLRDHLLVQAPALSLEAAWEMAEDTVPRVPSRGSLNLEEVRHADYFFA